MRRGLVPDAGTQGVPQGPFFPVFLWLLCVVGPLWHPSDPLLSLLSPTHLHGAPGLAGARGDWARPYRPFAADPSSCRLRLPPYGRPAPARLLRPTGRPPLLVVAAPPPCCRCAHTRHHIFAVCRCLRLSAASARHVHSSSFSLPPPAISPAHRCRLHPSHRLLPLGPAAAASRTPCRSATRSVLCNPSWGALSVPPLTKFPSLLFSFHP